MSEELLYFNGVNGATGTYGLEPMTAAALSEQIQDDKYAEAEAIRKAEERLKTAANKVTDIVRLLAESNLAAIEGRFASPAEWRTQLAQGLASLLLGEGIEPGALKRLESKLEQDTPSLLSSIVKLLVTSGGYKDLAQLLMADADLSVEDYIKRNTDYQLSTLKQARLAQSIALALEQDASQRKPWLEALIKDLRVLPIDSIKALKGQDNSTLTDPLNTLLDALEKLPRGGNAWLERLITRLDQLYAQGRNASWFGLLDILGQELSVPVSPRTGVNEVGAPSGRDGAQPPWRELLGALDAWLDALRDKIAHRGAVEWVDPTRLDQAGWGIILPAAMKAERKAAIKEALAPLLEWRRAQAGKYFKVYEDEQGYRPGESANAFLSRYGARASDPADPEHVPYYLLIVGNPDEIPFQFQYQLDVQYAVGRIDFGDDLAAYEHYARNVAAAEQANFVQSPTVTFFAVRNPGDQATEMSATRLVEPLYNHFKDKTLDIPWRFNFVPPEAATKRQLLDLMKQGAAPAFLFTASHGLEFDCREPEMQRQNQGALLCSDWNGRAGPISQDWYVSGQDIRNNDQVGLQGAIAFFFACYGAGTPLYDEYYKQEFKTKGKIIAERPFVADLPKAMLSLSQRGALAVVGHLERAWGTSFLGEAKSAPRSIKSEHVAVFESAIERLLTGHPLGSAMEYFNVRYAALSTELTVTLDSPVDPNPRELAALWTANNDARGYLIIGDPAVRLRAAQK